MMTTQPLPSSSESTGKSTASNVSLTIREGQQPVGNRQGEDGQGNPSEPFSSPRKVEEQQGRPNPFQAQERVEEQQGRPNYYVPYPKLDFLNFCGEEPREWSGKCEQYFRIYQIPEPQWVEVATMHFSGKAHRWKEGYLIDKPNITWEELSEAVCKRFGDSGIGRYVREFNKLTQTSTVEKYQERFEDLRAKMLFLNPTLSERHFIESYISGLKEELVPFIDLSHPTTLEEVYEQAILNEQALSIIMRKSRTGYRAPVGTATGNSGYKHRKAAGLCYRCGEKYQPGHQCQSKTLHLISGHEEPDEVFDERLLQEVEEEEQPPAGEEREESGVSIHALSGQHHHDTIKVQGEVDGKAVTILIDTGSTHSFIDFQVAKEVKAHMTGASPLTVTVANGHKVVSKLKCTDFKWTMQGEPFQFELRVIRLDGSSIILGIDWLRTYGKVTFEYSNLLVTFIKEGKQISLKGISEGSKMEEAAAELKAITAVQWYKAGLEGNCCAIGHYYSSETLEEEKGIPLPVGQVLTKFEEIFQEPKGLPPSRN
uniref:Ty3 transposon capsid-like protein domain-containing protein n=1 Tax=Ananas comosus var. bracteatus TaxID=296719 RepID=A0A6V7QJT1_ANACO|nr:unnamed protein product [Ananas comosus var. bracteatus]